MKLSSRVSRYIYFASWAPKVLPSRARVSLAQKPRRESAARSTRRDSSSRMATVGAARYTTSSESRAHDSEDAQRLLPGRFAATGC